MILAVAEEQVQVAVAVEVVLVDALQNAGARYIQVLPCVAAQALSKALESARGPGSEVIYVQNMPNLVKLQEKR